MKLFKLTLAIAVGTFFLVGTTAEAGEVFRTIADGAWNNSDTWEWVSGDRNNEAYPQDTDEDATIREGDTVHVTSSTAICGTLTIDGFSDAILSMEDAGVLQVETSVTVTAPGVFRFNANSGTQPKVRATGVGVDLEGPFSAPGSLGGLFDRTSTYDFDVLEGETATFDGPYDVTISAPIDVDGTLTCTGGTVSMSAQVDNGGTINANAGNVTFTGSFITTALGTFQVSHASSTMLFNQSAAVCFEDNSGPPDDGADFTISAGVFDIDQSVRSCGNLSFTGGSIQVAANEAFAAGLADCP